MKLKGQDLIRSIWKIKDVYVTISNSAATVDVPIIRLIIVVLTTLSNESKVLKDSVNNIETGET